MRYTQARWGDAAKTTIIAERADGAWVSIPADAENADYHLITQGRAASEYEPAIEPLAIAPYQRWPDLAAAKAELTAEVEAIAVRARAAVIGTSDPAKVTLYREKYEVAVAALAGDQAAIDLIAPEAAARGETPADLAALIKSLGDAWKAAGFALEAVSGGHKAAIDALADLAAAEAYDVSAGWP